VPFLEQAAANLTNVSPFAAMFMAVMSILILTLPRRLAVLPVMMTVCYLTLGQVINVGGLHFTLMRVMLLAGWIRVLSRREFRGLSLNIIDKVIIAWVVCGALMYIIRQGASSAAIVNQLGFVYNAFMTYFLFRALVRDQDEVLEAIKILAIVILPLAALICVERVTAKNIFSVFGGVPELTQVRDGKLRCQGPFVNPILTGTFGATSIPLLIAVWVNSQKSCLIAAAVVAAVSIALLASSSGPAMALLGVIVGFAMWRFRENIRVVWWAVLVAVLSLHLAMKSPVWALIGRVSELTGGGGYHRSELITQAVNHIGEWWFWGTDYTAHWMPAAVLVDYPTMIDITNQYIHEGVSGGILTMLLFISIIVLCFRQLGRRLRVLYMDGAKGDAMATWAIGVAVLAHALSFLSVSYFDQLAILWYFVLSCVSCTSGYVERFIAGEEETPEGIA
jgi:hypothetical protein